MFNLTISCLLCTNILINLLALFSIIKYRKHPMSDSLNNLTAALNTLITDYQSLKAQVTNLTSQVSTLQVAQGTPDSALDALTNTVNNAINTSAGVNNG